MVNNSVPLMYGIIIISVVIIIAIIYNYNNKDNFNKKDNSNNKDNIKKKDDVDKIPQLKNIDAKSKEYPSYKNMVKSAIRIVNSLSTEQKEKI